MAVSRIPTIPRGSRVRLGAVLVLGALGVLLGLPAPAPPTSAAPPAPAPPASAAPRSLPLAAVPNMLFSAGRPAGGGPRLTLPAVPPVLGQIVFESNFYVDLMYADGYGRQTLTYPGAIDNDPELSPDGSQIVFGNGPYLGNDNLYVMDTKGQNVTRLTNNLENESEPVWSFDGTQIAFERSGDIFTMNADGSNQQNITNDSYSEGQPAWSPDGHTIAFVSTRNGLNANIYTIPATGGAVITLTNEMSYGMTNDDPDWSPDGRFIAFSSNRSGNEEIYVMNADGSNPQNITNNPAFDGNPSWSPDGNYIAFESTREGRSNIWTMQADGSNPQMRSGNDANHEPQWGIGPRIKVVDEQGTVVPGAEVYQNCTLQGNTDGQGLLLVPHLLPGDQVIARSLVYTGTTQKAEHDDWSYHVWLTNINQNDDGTQSAFVITDVTQLTQTTIVSKTNAQIGINLVASVEYNDTPAALQEKVDGLQDASQYLFDVTDGQMYFEKLELFEDKQHWADADIQFSPWVWPNANVGRLASIAGQMHMPGPGFDGNNFRGGWTQPNAYRTFIHEFGHYGFGAFDEYKSSFGDAQCTLHPDRNQLPDASAASIMDYQYSTSEMCDDTAGDQHNQNTDQGQILATSVWVTFVQHWDDDAGRWQLRTPSERGVVDPGPFQLSCMDTMTSTVFAVPAAACAPLALNVTILGRPVMTASVTLTHNGKNIFEGLTDANGQVNLYGAAAGDTVHATSEGFGHVMLSASKVLTGCNGTALDLAGGPAAPAAPAAATWPSAWLTGVPDFTQNRLTLTLHFDAAPPDTPTLAANQNGQNQQPVSLTYNPASHTYSGTYPFDPAQTLNFQADVGLPGTAGTAHFTYSLVAAQYHTAGPERGLLGRGAVPPLPAAWDVFPPENLVGVVVRAGSLPDGSGLLVGDTGLPAPPPGNLIAVGGPYSAQGQIAPSQPVTLTLEYQAAYFCGLQAGSAAVYRYTGSGWTALPTSLDGNWHQATAATSQWGIFAVFARPNPAAVFTDVPSTNPFYKYVEYTACRGIISGYADGTFRPFANTTRGQFSKMVALGLRWNLEQPATPTFADVPAGSPFALFVEAASRMGVISGYACGGPHEPCDPQFRPYFRPYATITRSQIAKILVLAAHYAIDTTGGPHFADVPDTNPFYGYIETLYGQGVISGYACGGPGEPCDAAHRPYFRPGANATRGQISKMIYLVLQPR